MWQIPLIIFFLLWIYFRTKKPKNFPPGPPRLPLIGSIPYLASSGGIMKGIIAQVNIFLTFLLQPFTSLNQDQVTGF